jgi:hypothetical protein
MRGIRICSRDPGPIRTRTGSVGVVRWALPGRAPRLIIRVAVPDEGQTGYVIRVALSAAGVGVLTPSGRLGNHALGTRKEWE